MTDTVRILATRDSFGPTGARLMSTHLLAGLNKPDQVAENCLNISVAVETKYTRTVSLVGDAYEYIPCSYRKA
jgi:hypothetical protein